MVQIEALTNMEPRTKLVIGGVLVAGAATTVAWRSLDEETRRGIIAQLSGLRDRFASIRAQNVEFPPTIFADILSSVDWTSVSVSLGIGLPSVSTAVAVACKLTPQHVAAVSDKACAILETSMGWIETGAASGSTCFLYSMIALYQLCIAYQLYGLVHMKPEELASELGFDLVKLKEDVDALTQWWTDIDQDPNRSQLQEFLRRSEDITLDIEGAQTKIMRRNRDVITARNRSEAVAVAGMIGSSFLAGAAFRCADWGRKFVGFVLGTTAATVATGAAFWSVSLADQALSKLEDLNKDLKKLSNRLKIPVEFLENDLARLQKEDAKETAQAVCLNR